MISKAEKSLYKNLIKVCNSSDDSKFFFKDVTTPFGSTHRIFSYHYASYSDWCLEDALECRGIMFEMDGDKPVRISARPMEKFFNLNETPFTMNLDLTTIKYTMAKADGSLISSFIDNDQLFMKSKTSISSEQSYAALQVINTRPYEEFRARVIELAKAGYTCNMEYVAPDNRIVLPYGERALILLNVRENSTGEYVDLKQVFADSALRPFLVETFNGKLNIEEIRKQEGIEGYVVELESGLKFKLKTDWYCALHRTKDSITKNEALFDAVVNGASDDLRGMFYGDDWAINKINEFEKVHLKYLTNSIAKLTDMHNALRGTDRKTFALQAQTQLKNSNEFYLFSLLMKYYQNGLDSSSMIDNLNSIFMKYFEQFVPEQYVKETIILEK